VKTGLKGQRMLDYGKPTRTHLKQMKQPIRMFQISQIPDTVSKLHPDCLTDGHSMTQQANDILVNMKLNKPTGLDMEADLDLLKAYIAFIETALDVSIENSNLLRLLLDESTGILLKEKYKHNYPRPKQVVKHYLGKSVDPHISSQSANHPAYPSGHSAQARLLAHLFNELIPNHESFFEALSQSIGLGRVIAGLHTISDHEYGCQLGDLLFVSIRPEALGLIKSMIVVHKTTS